MHALPVRIGRKNKMGRKKAWLEPIVYLAHFATRTHFTPESPADHQHELRSSHVCLILNTNTSSKIAIPRLHNPSVHDPVLSVAVELDQKNNELCCEGEDPSYLIVSNVCPLESTHGRPTHFTVCDCTPGIAPRIRRTTLRLVEARLRAMITPGGANAFDLQRCIVWVNFIQQGDVLCGILASLYNGIVIVVPMEEDAEGNDIFLWDKIQHVHGDIERVKEEDGTDAKFPENILEIAMNVLRID